MNMMYRMSEKTSNNIESCLRLPINILIGQYNILEKQNK